LVSQRGLIDIEPGDFVAIPRGCAFTSIHAGPSAQLTLCSRHPIPQVAETARTAVPATAQALANARAGVPHRP
jgi:homogentisate 1,2-dioxygenase